MANTNLRALGLLVSLTLPVSLVACLGGGEIDGYGSANTLAIGGPTNSSPNPDVPPSTGNNTATDPIPPTYDGCGDLTMDIYAGQNMLAGTATVSHTANGTVLVDVATSGVWTFTTVHIYLGTDPVPTNAGGNPAPGLFPYVTEYEGFMTSHQLTVPMVELGVGCVRLGCIFQAAPEYAAMAGNAAVNALQVLHPHLLNAAGQLVCIFLAEVLFDNVLELGGPVGPLPGGIVTNQRKTNHNKCPGSAKEQVTINFEVRSMHHYSTKTWLAFLAMLPRASRNSSMARAGMFQ